MDAPKLMGLQIIQKGFSVKRGIFSENARHFDVKYFATFEPGKKREEIKSNAPPPLSKYCLSFKTQ